MRAVGRALLSASIVLLLGRAGGPSPLVRRSGLLALSADGRTLLVVNPDSRSVSAVDLPARRLVAEIAVGGTPQTVAMTADESRALVPTREGSVAIVDLAAMRKSGSITVGGELFGAVTDQTRLYVAASGTSRIAIFDLSSGQSIGSIATEETPRGLALVSGRLYVTHFRSGRLTVADTTSMSVQQVISTGADSNLSQSVWISGNRAYLPHTRSNAGNPALLFDSTVFPVVSVIDLDAGQNLQRDRIAIDVADRPGNMPFDMTLTAQGKLYVVLAGSDDVSVIDLAQKKAVAHIAVGSNPRGILLSPDEGLAYVDNTLSGTVSVIDTQRDQVVDELTVTTIPLSPSVLNGKRLFHTSSRTTLSKDRWISCATCHFDGGADGRTWFFRDGARNTTALFGVAETLPMHWSGDLDELQDVESTIRIVQAGSGLASGESNCDPACDSAAANAGRSRDLDDLAAFMASLQPPPHPGGLDAAAVARGKVLFNDRSVGCASCHVAPLFTDRQKHDVGTGRTAVERKGTVFDTPSLRGIHATAPYFHDGSAATLDDVVSGAMGQHGDTRTLSAAERHDLVEFLRSIDFVTPRRRAVTH